MGDHYPFPFIETQRTLYLMNIPRKYRKVNDKVSLFAISRMTFDKLKKDIHLWKEELRAKTEGRPQKEWKLSSLRHDLEQMKYTMESYKACLLFISIFFALPHLDWIGVTLTTSAVILFI